jgi:uncharacterized membrane protein
MVALLSVVAATTSGLVAGVLFAVALSVLPGLWAMPADRYVYAHQLIGRHWDPTMPLLVLTSAAIEVTLSLLVPPPAAVLYAVGAGLLLCVSVVSHFCNVPLNRGVKALDPEHIPGDWRDPRPVWRRWHTLRTCLAVAAALVAAAAAHLS